MKNIAKIKEKRKKKRDLKQRVKSAPKELVRRGLDDGTERLRGQLQDTAQRGQADDYGGDRIEDTTVAGVRRTGRGIEALIKRRKKDKDRVSDEEPHTLADSSASQEPPAELSAQGLSVEPSPQGYPQVKTEETIVASEGRTVPYARGREELIPAAGSERQRIKIRGATTDTSLTLQDETQPLRIRAREYIVHAPSVGEGLTVQPGAERQQVKTRESAVRDIHTDTTLVPRDGTQLPRIRTRESAVQDIYADTSLVPRDRTQPLQIKTREAAVYDSPVGAEPAVQLEPEQPWIKIRESTIRDIHVDVPLPVQDGTLLPRIKTREAVGCGSFAGEDLMPQTGAEYPQVRAKEIILRDPRTNAALDPQTAPEAAQIKVKDTVTDVSLDHIAAPALPSEKRASNRLSIKTKDAYMQKQAAMGSDQTSQVFVQGQQAFMQEQGRKTAIKRAEDRRIVNSIGPRTVVGKDAVPSVPVWQGSPSSGHAYPPPAHVTYHPTDQGYPDARPVQISKKTISKPMRSTKKKTERTARYAIKTVERFPGKSIKATQRDAKTATGTAKTAGQTTRITQQAAQTSVQTTRQTVQTTRATAGTVATITKATAESTAVAIKAAIAAIQSMVAAIAAGGWMAVVVTLMICLVGLLIVSPFGIFFSDGGGSSGVVSPSVAVAQINQEYADTLSDLQAGDSYDSVEIIGGPPAWMDVFAVFAVKTVTGDGVDVVILDADRVERLRTVFWDMTKITTEVSTIEHPASEDADAWTETVLTITVTPRTPDDMRVFYAFTAEQNAALDALLTAESRALWSDLLYGSSGEIVAVALSQVGNVGGQLYWSWYGFSSHVDWCACFVSWCANECGYIDAGIIPKFASCTAGSAWFKNQGQWQGNSYEPRPGDIIFFDWDNRGSSGPQDNVPDHVGIVERVENGIVYTVEGNSGDSCRQRSYSVGHYEIWGYATPTY